MEIRINKLRMRNFKGVRSAEYTFSGQNARIEGPNGSGKSTVFDAFTWLLFGKDHRGQTTETFELKTIDPATGKPYPREDHWVEAELTVDGRPTTIRRAWVENWVKPSGQIEEVFKGHTAAFFIDGVNVGTKKAFDEVVTGWVNEDMFKLLTNPLYFIDDAFTPWKARRKALMDLVKDAPGRDAIREEFKDVVAEISGRDIDACRKQLAQEKAANKRDLDAALKRIDGMREALPAAVSAEEVQAQLKAKEDEFLASIAALRAEKDSIDKSIASAEGADEERKAENARIWAEITKVQLWMNQRVVEARKAAMDKNSAITEQKSKAEREMREAERHLAFHMQELDKLRYSLKDAEQERGRAAEELAALGEEYHAEKKKFFDYKPSTRCAACGQELPVASIEAAIAKAKEDFQAERKAAIERILSKSEAIKKNVKEGVDPRIADLRSRIQQEEVDITAGETKLELAKAEVRRLVEIPAVSPDKAEEQVRASEEFKAKRKEELDLNAKAMGSSSRPDDLEALITKRSDIEKQLEARRDEYDRSLVPIRERLSVNKVRKDQEALIAQKEQEAKCFADAVARSERLEARVAEYVKRDVESVCAAIDSLFKTAHWKMFDQTLDGGFIEVCEVTSPEGVPYRSMNDAMKILCGMDCIRVFSERFGMSAPIFVDNAEGVLLTNFGTPAQVIRLVVADREQITMINE